MLKLIIQPTLILKIEITLETEQTVVVVGKEIEQLYQNCDGHAHSIKLFCPVAVSLLPN